MHWYICTVTCKASFFLGSTSLFSWIERIQRGIFEGVK